VRYLRNMDAQAALQNANRVTALVVGDVMLDAYLVGHVNRISPEAPVPIVDVRQRDRRLGGAANVAKNLIALGSKVHIAAVTGHDAAGEDIANLFDELNVGTSALLRSENRPTTVKTRVISNGQQLLRVDEEETNDIEESTAESLCDRCEDLLNTESIDVIIFEDYDKGTLTDYVIQRLTRVCREKGIKTTVDPKFRHFHAYQGVTLFKPNFKELQEGLGIAIHKNSDASLNHAIQALMEQLRPEIAMVTLSERGVCIASATQRVAFQRIPAFEREITDVSGAGDAVIAVASVLLALDVPIWQIAAVANLAGGLVCEKVGVVPVELERLQSEWETHRLAMESLMDKK